MWINITMRLPLEQPWTSYTCEDIHVNLQNTILFVFLMYHTFLVHLYLYYTLLYIGISICIHTCDMHHHIPSTTTPFRPEANNDLPIFFGCFRGGKNFYQPHHQGYESARPVCLGSFWLVRNEKIHGSGDDGD